MVSLYVRLSVCGTFPERFKTVLLELNIRTVASRYLMADTSHSLNERRDVFPDKSQIGQRVLAILHGPDTWRVSVVVKFSHLGPE